MEKNEMIALMAASIVVGYRWSRNGWEVRPVERDRQKAIEDAEALWQEVLRYEQAGKI